MWCANGSPGKSDPSFHVPTTAIVKGLAPIVSLAAAGDGSAVVPQAVLLVQAVPLFYRGQPIGRWETIAGNSQRLLVPHAHDFV
jgi:hypothetical protein